jgi:hypothetical protein
MTNEEKAWEAAVVECNWAEYRAKRKWAEYFVDRATKHEFECANKAWSKALKTKSRARKKMLDKFLKQRTKGA